MTGPLVTAIMPTRGRRAWLPAAIACFLAQTEVQRSELLILNAGEPVEDLIPAAAAGRIRVEIAPAHFNHGQMCNLACELAEGGIIAHWDDDDYSAPGRLEYQLAVLRNGSAQVSCFHAMKFLELKTGRWWQYDGGSHAVLGTSLVYTRSYWKQKPFLPIPCGSDQFFGDEARRDRVLHSSADLNLMYATAHSGNTSPRAFNASDYKPLASFSPPNVWPRPFAGQFAA